MASKEEDEVPPPERPPSPPLYTSFAVRQIHPPSFSAFKPRDYKLPTVQAMSHVAWNCDGKKLAAVGVDKIVRVWIPDKSMDWRACQTFSGGHSEDVDWVAWNPRNPDLFCTSSSRDRRIVFWDSKSTRYIQQVPLKVSPTQVTYAPDGNSLLYTTTNNQLYFMAFGQKKADAGSANATSSSDAKSAVPSTKEEWHHMNCEVKTGSYAIFNHVGDGIVVTHQSEHLLRVIDYPSLTMRESPAAHVGGCGAVALDPRGRYLASGGKDSIVNMFDLNDWICARTITVCEHSINALSFSYDGEYLAIANGGCYIDICATETGLPLHRVPTLGPSPTVTWHPSRHLIAYCGQTRHKEAGPPPAGTISTFGVPD